MNSTGLEGDLQRAGGTIQSTIGKVAGDRELEAEGVANETAGAVKQVVGHVRDAAGTAIGAGQQLLDEGFDRLPRSIREVRPATSLGVLAVAALMGAGAYWLFTQTSRAAAAQQDGQHRENGNHRHGGKRHGHGRR